MIIALGMDIVEIDRFAGVMQRKGDRFLQRLFTAREIEYCQSMPNPAAHFAVRFAAKEAFSKAIGTGIAEGLQWIDVEVARAQNGRPSIQTSGRASDVLQRLAVTRCHLTLSHSRGIASAVVVLEGPHS